MFCRKKDEDIVLFYRKIAYFAMRINTFLPEFLCSNRINKWKITITVNARIPAPVMEIARHVRSITEKTVQKQIAEKAVLIKR